MNKRSVTELYHRFVGTGSVPDADQLAAQIASSPARAQLLDFSRDLEPESAALSAKLAIALNPTDVAIAHRRHGASRRGASGARRWRGVAALAAALLAAVVVWSPHLRDASSPATPVANAKPADRIFADDTSMATSARTGARDQIFRDEFRGDEIFNSSKSHDG
jgi:hypothetical protein